MPSVKLLLRCTHGMHGGGGGLYAPFLQLWERQLLKLSPSYIGNLSAVGAVVNVLGVPIICRVVDKTGNIRSSFAVLTLIDGLLHAGFMLMPVFVFGCHWWSHAARLFIVLPVVIIAELIHSSTYSVLDAITMQYLADKLEYGRIRLPAGITWAITCLSVGVAQQLWPVNLSLIFLGFALFFCSISALWACKPPPAPFRAAELPKNPRTPNMDCVPFSQRLRRMFCSRRLTELMSIMFIMGVGAACANSFVFLLIDDLGGSTFVMSLSLVLNIVTETPVFWYSKWLVTKLGNRGVLYAGMLAYMLRLGWYGIAWNPWVVLIAEPLHGFTFALVWSNLATIAAEIAPEGYETLAQGMLNAVFNGLGGFVGSVVGGRLYERSPKLMFGTVACLMAFVLLCMMLTDFCRRLRGPSTPAARILDEELM